VVENQAALGVRFRRGDIVENGFFPLTSRARGKFVNDAIAARSSFQGDSAEIAGYTAVKATGKSIEQLESNSLYHGPFPGSSLRKDR
jgi:hypothetical protein